MVVSRYSWKEGARLDEHSRRKHKILREYFSRYLSVRCAFPQQSKFRLAIVEGFAGAGRYECGTAGSPLIFIEELRTAVDQFNVKRQVQGMAPLEIECLLMLNDADAEIISMLQSHVELLLRSIEAEGRGLKIEVVYSQKPFEVVYPELKERLISARYRNVLFNLDQYGYSDVQIATLTDISTSFNSAECFYTFGIASLLAFLSKTNPNLLARQLSFLGVTSESLASLDAVLSRHEWLGAAERLVFEVFRGCARYVSPFSINNPDGWRYWLIHLSNSYRARQEYNNVLHQNSSMQAHFGRSGLHMLSFDPAHSDGLLYLFDAGARTAAKEQLTEDIPRIVAEYGDAIAIEPFYSAIYNMTPAHMDDIHAAVMMSSELEVLTRTGSARRKPNTIRVDDTLRLKRQRSFFPLF